MQQFLGVANYYAHFIANFATIAAPISDLCRKEAKFVWSDACEAAFTQLRDSLCTAPVLCTPDFAPDAEFVIETDASDVAIGAVLQQDQGAGLQPVAYFSRKLNTAERNYPVHERELLAVVSAARKWRPYLDGRVTTVITDHKTLVNFNKQPHLSKRQVRWLQTLSENALHIVYRPGEQAAVPDALSRIPGGLNSQDNAPATGVTIKQIPHGVALVRDDVDSTNGTEEVTLSTLAWAQLTSAFVQEAQTLSEHGLAFSLVVEPTFLANVSARQFDTHDSEMGNLVATAQSNDPMFRIEARHGVELLYRCADGKSPQLVIPAAGGFR